MPDRTTPECNVRRRTTCSNCGADLEKGGAICHFCGSQVGDSLSDADFQEACRVFIQSINKTLQNVFSARTMVFFVVGTVAVPLAAFFILRSFGWPTWVQLSIPIVLALTGLFIVGVAFMSDQRRIFRKHINRWQGDQSQRKYREKHGAGVSMVWASSKASIARRTSFLRPRSKF